MNIPLELINKHRTPLYCYNAQLLEATLKEVKHQASLANIQVHYAIKANANLEVLKLIAQSGIGADCVSRGEIAIALDAGFQAQQIVFAGVGKRDDEIAYALEQGVGCFNVESIQELHVIQQIAEQLKCQAPIALRISPNIDAHTHQHITTGLESNKFGIAWEDAVIAAKQASELSHLQLIGIHFHIGSQIRDLSTFQLLAEKVNLLQAQFKQHHIRIQHVNIGGGLGIDYHHPSSELIPPFKAYFKQLQQHLALEETQTVHCELGRSIVAQCGSLISKVLFVKDKGSHHFIILDAGFNDLVRPAFYDAYHHIHNLTSASKIEQSYTIAGPICESSDIFASEYKLPITQRGDYIAIDSCGAYGESMASCYNMRQLPDSLVYYPTESYDANNAN